MRRLRWAPEVVVALCAHLLVVVTNGAVNRVGDGGALLDFALGVLIGFPVMLLLLASPILLLNVVDRRIRRKRHIAGRVDNTVFGQFLIRQQRDAFNASAALVYASLLFADQFETIRPVIVVFTVAAALTAAIHIRLFVISFRIRSGFYGTNEREARELVHFAMAERNHNDMSGGLGARHLSSATDVSQPVSLAEGAPV